MKIFLVTLLLVTSGLYAMEDVVTWNRDLKVSDDIMTNFFDVYAHKGILYVPPYLAKNDVENALGTF